jgi:cystathionine beta-lyase/cystathionine gamma-synthase
VEGQYCHHSGHLQGPSLIFLSLILNPEGPFYSELRAALIVGYEDQLWAEDAIFLERNSRDFVSRVGRINNNAEAVCQLLLKHPKSMSLIPRSIILIRVLISNKLSKFITRNTARHESFMTSFAVLKGAMGGC